MEGPHLRKERENIRRSTFERGLSGQAYGSMSAAPREGLVPPSSERVGAGPGTTSPARLRSLLWCSAYQIASTHSGWSMKGFRLPWYVV